MVDRLVRAVGQQGFSGQPEKGRGYSKSNTGSWPVIGYAARELLCLLVLVAVGSGTSYGNRSRMKITLN